MERNVALRTSSVRVTRLLTSARVSARTTQAATRSSPSGSRRRRRSWRWSRAARSRPRVIAAVSAKCRVDLHDGDPVGHRGVGEGPPHAACPSAEQLGVVESGQRGQRADAGERHVWSFAPGQHGPVRASGDRAPRRERRPARAHAQRLRGRDRAGRRRPGDRRRRRPATASSSAGTSTRSAAPPTSPSARSSPTDARPARCRVGRRRPGGSSRTSPTPSCAPCAPASGCRGPAPAARRTTGPSRCPPFAEVLDLVVRTRRSRGRSA